MTVRRIAAVFSSEASFHPDLGSVLAEHHPGFRAAVETHDRLMPTSLEDLLWCRPRVEVDASDAQRRAAVVATTAGLWQVFADSYGLRAIQAFGYGVGSLVAGFAAGNLSLYEIIQRAAGDDHTEQATFVRDDASFAERINPSEVLAIIDFGPNEDNAAALRQAFPNEIPIAAVESATNPMLAHDILERRRFFNLAHIVERTLGQMVATKNRSSAQDAGDTVLNLSRRVKAMLREPISKDWSATPSKQDLATLREAISLWITNGLVKEHDPAAILASLHALEDETLVPVTKLLGINQRTLTTLDWRRSHA